MNSCFIFHHDVLTTIVLHFNVVSCFLLLLDLLQIDELSRFFLLHGVFHFDVLSRFLLLVVRRSSFLHAVKLTFIECLHKLAVLYFDVLSHFLLLVSMTCWTSRAAKLGQLPITLFKHYTFETARCNLLPDRHLRAILVISIRG